MNDVVYCRYSSHKQDDGTSIEVQIEICEKLAGKKLVRYIDEAKTGRTIAGRRALADLIGDAQAGKISKLYVYKYDRIGRDAAASLLLLSQLEAYGVKTISATEGQDYLARGIQIVVADSYSKILAERTRDGQKKRFDQGWHTGGRPPFGYKVIDLDGKRKLVIDENQSAVVVKMFNWYLEDCGYKEIAKRLADSNMPTSMGGLWSKTTIKAIVDNPIYTGRIRFGCRQMILNKQTGRRIPKANDKSKILERYDESLRIISDEIFDGVQKLRMSRRRPMQRRRDQVLPWTSHLRCPVCGTVFYGRRSRNKKGDYVYWMCGKRYRHGSNACENKTVLRDDQLIAQLHAAVRESFDQADEIAEQACKIAKKELEDGRQEHKKIDSQIGELDKQIASNLKLLTDDVIDEVAKKAISRLIGEAEIRRDELRSRKNILADQAMDNAEKLGKVVKSVIHSMKKDLETIANQAQWQSFIERHIGELLVNPDGTVEAASLEKTKLSEGSESSVTRVLAGAGVLPGHYALCLIARKLGKNLPVFKLKVAA